MLHVHSIFGRRSGLARSWRALIAEACQTLRTNLEELERRLQSDEDVFCIVTTTSCFAPRAPDDVVGVARLCLKHNVRHVVNNAYGVQCSKTCAQIARASRVSAALRVLCRLAGRLRSLWSAAGGLKALRDVLLGMVKPTQ